MTAQDNIKANGKGERVGVYICHCGGNISDHVDVEQVAGEARQMPGVALARTNVFMCSDPGQELIQKDIAEGRIDRVVVASCAPSLHELTFRGAIDRSGMNPFLYEHANIREQVSWVHDGAAATRKASGLVGAAVAKARDLEPLSPIRVEAQRHVTVIGGGVAGLRASLDLSRRSLAVTLVERSAFLGGQTARLDRLAPTGEAADAIVRRMAADAAADERITVLTGAEIVQASGYVGNFSLTVRHVEAEAGGPSPAGADGARAADGDYVPFAGYYPHAPLAAGEEVVFQTGALVFATGFTPYLPGIGQYAFRQSEAVITIHDLIREMAVNPVADDRLVMGGRPVRRVALIHCVGSRQIPGIDEPDAGGRLNEHCSRTCCSATLQAALAIRQRHPGTHVLEYYRDIRTYGRGQEELYEAAGRQNVTFFRFEADSPPRVNTGDGGYPLEVTVADTLTGGENLTAGVDLVVLATGMQPGPIDKLIDMLKLPVGGDGFLQEVHPKLRPVEVANTGVLLAGTCQAPMDVGEACAAAQAAAVKATTLLARGYVELDPFVARVDAQRCDGQGRCLEVCPVEGAVALETTAAGPRAVVNPALCTGCGICVAECPRQALDVSGWTLSQYEAMVDAIVAA